VLEDVGLLAYSQWLLGFYRKILDGENIPTQINLFPQFARYNAPSALKRKVISGNARKNGLTLTELSLAFIEQQSL
jgi:hypothetical protein